ncbi:MAG: hypothetical protein J6A78_05525 [Clostridia bacterium]|nr:hypothetical protein [Clostridia bacterium]
MKKSLQKACCALICILVFCLCGCGETQEENKISLANAVELEKPESDKQHFEIRIYSDEVYSFSNRNNEFFEKFFDFIENVEFDSQQVEKSDFDYIYVSIYDGKIVYPFSIYENDVIGIHYDETSYYCEGIYEKFKTTFKDFFNENKQYCRLVQSPITMKNEYWIGNAKTHTQLEYDSISREPYLFYDSGIVHFWVQNGTGTLTRQARFYDVEKGLISPYYYGQTDYFGDLVSATDNARVVIYNMFTGKQVCVFDKFEKPLGNCIENIQSAYFSKDGTQMVVKYLNTDLKTEIQIFDLPKN